jgi:hypothetical protein
MSDLSINLLLAGLVCAQVFGAITYVLIKGDWWRS